jgi:hypothetical protein
VHDAISASAVFAHEVSIVVAGASTMLAASGFEANQSLFPQHGADLEIRHHRNVGTDTLERMCSLWEFAPSLL